RVEAFLDGHLADDVRHFELGDTGDPARCVHEREAERLRDAPYGLHRLIAVQPDAAAEKIVGIDVTEHDIGVGNGGYRSAFAVASGSRIGPSGFGADRKRLRLRVDARERAAARADCLDV